MSGTLVENTFEEQLMAIVLASRPSGWCFGPILFVIGLIQSRSIPKDMRLLLIAAVQLFSLSFPLCAIVFGMNDIYDYETDLLNPRKLAAGLEGGVLSPDFHRPVRQAAYISTALILLVSLATANLSTISATAVLVFFGWQYSTPPLRLKEIPIVDSLCNGVIVFLTWFVGYSYGRGGFRHISTKGIILSMCTVGVHSLGAAVDFDSDFVAGQNTIATFWGARGATLWGASMFILALWIDKKPSSVFRAYLWGGSLIMLAPCLHLAWAHYAFKVVVFWTVGMSMIWFGSKALGQFGNR